MNRQQDLELDRCLASVFVENPTARPAAPGRLLLADAAAAPLQRPVQPSPYAVRPVLRAALRILQDTRRVWREPLA